MRQIHLHICGCSCITGSDRNAQVNSLSRATESKPTFDPELYARAGAGTAWKSSSASATGRGWFSRCCRPSCDAMRRRTFEQSVQVVQIPHPRQALPPALREQSACQCLPQRSATTGTSTPRWTEQPDRPRSSAASREWELRGVGSTAVPEYRSCAVPGTLLFE